jgi:hypothetical protein
MIIFAEIYHFHEEDIIRNHHFLRRNHPLRTKHHQHKGSKPTGRQDPDYGRSNAFKKPQSGMATPQMGRE